MRLAIIADTHMPRGLRRLPDACVERLRNADAILHAGDFFELSTLRLLEGLGPPVHGVVGNVDSPELKLRLPRVCTVGRIAMIHDAGPAPGRLIRMRRTFPDADAVVFGTRTCRCTRSATGSRSSTPARRPSAGARPSTRWGWSATRPGGSSSS